MITTQAACSGVNEYWLSGASCSPNRCTPDFCATAFTIREGQPAIIGNNSDATTDTQLPGGCVSSKDVWFSFTADADGGVYQFDTLGSEQPQTVLALIFGGCGGLSSVCSVGNPHPSIIRPLAAGATVKVRVASAGTADGGGFVLNIVQTEPATGACCTTSTATASCFIASVGQCGTGTYHGDGSVCSPGLCPPAGSCCAESCCVVVQETVCAGVWTSGGTCAPGECGTNTSPPVNDACVDALPLVEGVPSVGVSCNATTDGSTTCGPSSADVWYTFTPGGSVGGGRPYVVDTEGSAFDTILAVFNGCNGEQIACDDDGGTFLNSRVELTLTPGQSVTIRLASFGASAPGGSYRLNVTPSGGGGACCCGSACSITTSTACTGSNRAFAGEGTSCTPYSATAPCCRADFNRSGGTPTVQDIFDFLGAYFAADACADTNDSGSASVQDIFDFLAAYFVGCP